MNWALAITTGLLGLALLTGCKEETPGHGHDHGHNGHDHAAPASTGGLGQHGTGAAIGEQEVGGYRVTAIQSGTIEPGGQGDFDVQVIGSTGAPKAIRCWIGVENSQGSVKTRARTSGPSHHIHVEVPDPLPDDCKFWVEIEPQTGPTLKVSFELKP